jgi:hypothetical protein
MRSSMAVEEPRGVLFDARFLVAFHNRPRYRSA